MLPHSLSTLTILQMKEEAEAFTIHAVKNASELEELIVYHKVNIKLGALCSALSILLLYCLLSSKSFRRRRKLIIALAFADLMNCVGILLMGVDRSLLYYNAIHFGHVNPETSWSCARQFWLLVKTTGDVWPPIVQCFMGTEKLISVCCNKESRKRANLLVLSSISITLAMLILGYLIAYSTRFDGNVKFYCGRKATFGRIFSGFIYMHNVIGYVSGVLFNTIALQDIGSKPNTLTASKRNDDDHVQQIRSCLIVSSISTILVSLPNCLSLFSLLVTSVKDSISKPAVWATCINSGVNLFIYLVLDQEFRQHFVYLWRRQKVSLDLKKQDERHQQRLCQCRSQIITCETIADSEADFMRQSLNSESL